MDAADARMAELKDRQDEASVSTATCGKEMLQVQTNLATALKMLKTRSARSVAMAKEQDNVAATLKEFLSSMEKLVSFTNNKMACVKENVFKTTQKRSASLAKAEQW